MNELLRQDIALPRVQVNWVAVAKALPKIAAAALALSLAVFAAAGWFCRPIQDDFIYATELHNRGFFGSIAQYWLHWFGRYFAHAVINLTCSSAGVRLAVPLVLAGMFGGWYLLGLRWNIEPVRSALLAGGLSVGPLLAAPDLLEPIYWRCALCIYALPLALAPWLLLATLYTRRPWLAFVMALASAGCAEVWTLILAGSALVALCGWRYYSKSMRLQIVAAALGAWIGAAVMFGAPGNAQRASGSDIVHLAIEPLLQATLKATVRFFSPSWVVTVFPMVALLLAVAVLSAVAFGRCTEGRVPVRAAIALTVIMPPTLFAAVFALCLPVVKAIGIQPYPRTMIIPAFVVVALCVAYGAIVGPWLSRWPVASAIGTAWALWALSGVLVSVPTFQFYKQQTVASLTDEREQFIRDAKRQGRLDLIVKPLPHPLDVSGDVNFWPNKVAAEYYGLRTIRVGR